MNTKFYSHLTKAMFSLMLGLTIISCGSDHETVVIPEIKASSESEQIFSQGLHFDSSTSSKTITFTSTVPWEITFSENSETSVWCRVSQEKGLAGTQNIVIEVDENTKYEDRYVLMNIKAGDIFKGIYINQKQFDAIILSPDKIDVPVEGGIIDIELKSNIQYQVNIPDECKEWIHQSTTQTRALVEKTMSFMIDANEDYEQRTGTIVFSGNGKKEVVTITQIGYGGILLLAQNTFEINNEEQRLEIGISSNFDYSVEIPNNVEWIRVENTTRAVTPHNLVLLISQNTGYDARSAKIKVFDVNSSISEEITITQGPVGILNVDKHEVEIDERGGNFTLEVNTTLSYQVIINSDWISQETSGTRALTTNNLSFNVNPITDNRDREGSIILYNSKYNLEEKIVIKQSRSIFFDTTSLRIIEGEQKQLNLTNLSSGSVSWSSSNTSVATVDNGGVINALSRGTTTITATSADGLHTCKCEVTVNAITDYISASWTGGTISNLNGVIQYGSSLNWTFNNNSSVKVLLKSLQLIDGVTSSAGNQMFTNADVASNSSVSYSVKIGLAGIHAPVTCRFRYEYNEKEYYIDAVYTGN